MCNLCSSDPAEVHAEKKRLSSLSNKLSRLSKEYDNLAIGSIKPHSNDAKRVAMLSRMIIRDLVEEWV